MSYTTPLPHISNFKSILDIAETGPFNEQLIETKGGSYFKGCKGCMGAIILLFSTSVLIIYI